MARVSIVSSFPPGFFLENIEVLRDGGIFVTVANRQELYFIRPSQSGEGAPLLVHTFDRDQWAMGIVAAPQNPNVFYMVTSDGFKLGSKECHLHVIDTSNAGLGSRPQSILTLPSEAKLLNGLCALSGSTLIAADSFGSCIWAMHLDLSTFPPKTARAEVWCKHPSLAGELILPDFQPGANGLKYSALTGAVYFTSTQQKLFARVHVNPKTLDAEGEVEILATGMQGDDLLIDEKASGGPVAYVTTHRENTILKIPLGQKSAAPPLTAESCEIAVEGSERLESMLGPTAGVWIPGREGQSAYFATDGGLKNPLADGVVRCAKVVRVDL